MSNKNNSKFDQSILARTKVLYEEHKRANYRDTDRLFMYFFILQWFACIIAAVFISPKTWEGTESTVHLHVWSAIFLGGLITLFPAYVAYKRPGNKETRYIVAVSQALVSALLIDLTGGRIETHFHVFGSLAILAFYREWRVLVPYTLMVGFDHWLRGAYWPESVYGIMTPDPWRWIEHTGWVLFEDAFLIISCLHSQREMHEIALRKARDEKSQQIIEAKVVERTTALRESEERFRHSEKMAAVGQLAGGIAHDLNNGLTPILGYLDYLLDSVKKEDAMHEPLSEAKQAAQRCAQVVEKILGFSRRSPQKKNVFEVDRLMREHSQLIKSLFPSTIEIKFELERNLEPIHGNEADILTVLMNLAINAKDAMSSGPGAYRVEARNVKLYVDPTNPENKIAKDYVLIRISDTGCGMSPEIVQRIYEPFFTTKVKDKGTGLGLTMVFNIVKEHHGWIDVSSQPGKGTVFQMYLPACKDAVAGEAQVEDPVPSLSHANKRILLVDDEENIRNMGREFLTKMDCAVVTANNGEDAVKIYAEKSNQIDAVILDMTMPKLTGVETFRRLRAINPRAKVIASSGYTQEGNEEELLKEGFCDFLAKPYTIRQLAQKLSKTLEDNSERSSKKESNHG